MRRLLRLVCLLILISLTVAPVSDPSSKDPRLKNGYRRPPKNGWTFVHLQGTPAEIGYQHGYLLAPEIEDMLNVFRLELTHDLGKDWQFFRNQAQQMMWPHIEKEYREELQGIVDGAQARNAKLDLWDVVALNGALEWEYFVPEYDKQHGKQQKASIVPPEHCSAFVATGSYTRDGRIVIAHNNWTTYLDGARWTVIFDVVPSKGQRFIMDGPPGFIHSADDFGINAAGIAITETTISRFAGYNASGIPEFVRARKAMQYSTSIDDFARIMQEGNNGGYANDWLVADSKTNEVASLELGLKNVTLQRTKDGYFVGSNYPISKKLAREETSFDLHDMSLSANARHIRWEQLMAGNKGKIDLAAAQRFLADHTDSYDKKTSPSERTLCGHVELSPRGSRPWQPPYGIAGTAQNKAADASLVSEMALTAAAGHACGIDFKASAHLNAHPEFSWQRPLLRDMDSHAWTTFTASR